MKWIISLCIAGLLGVFFYLLPQPEQNPVAAQTLAATDIAVTDVAAKDNNFVIGPVQLFDGERWHAQMYLEIHKGRVQQWHAQAPVTDLPIIDGKGYWLVPGLIDAHVHAWGDALTQNLQFGVTTVLDQFGQPDFLKAQQALRSQTTASQVADLFGAGYLATVAGGHGTQYGFSIPVVAAPADAAAFVQARKAEGSDWIKLVYRSEKARQAGKPSLDLATLQALISAAKQHQMQALVHIEDHNSALEAVLAGANGLVHGFFDAPVSAELIAAMQANGSFIIPTLVVMEGFLQQTINQELVFKAAPTWLTPAIKGQLQQHLNFGPKNPAAFARMQQNVLQFYQAGIPVLAGSDAPNPNTAHGVSLVVEMELLRRAGLPADAVLQSATGRTAKAFQLPEQGRLTPGAKADFLWLASDPRQDFTVMWQAAGIWKNGWRQATAAAAEAAVALRPGNIADFRHSDQARQGVFQATDDRLMQGKSQAQMQWQPGQALHISGIKQAGFAYPWAGLNWQLTADMDGGADLRALQQLRFRIRGTPGQYQLQVFVSGHWTPYVQPFAVTADWQWLEIPLAGFAGLDRSAVSMLNWIAPMGEFQFELEQIELR